MDAFLWSTSVHATALALAKGMDTEELTRTALFFTQLGTTMATIAALQGLDEANAAEVEADLEDIV